MGTTWRRWDEAKGGAAARQDWTRGGGAARGKGCCAVKEDSTLVVRRAPGRRSVGAHSLRTRFARSRSPLCLPVPRLPRRAPSEPVASTGPFVTPAAFLL